MDLTPAERQQLDRQAVDIDEAHRRQLGIPYPLWHKTFANFTARDEAQEAAAAQVMRFVTDFEEHCGPYSRSDKVGRGLLLAGPCNTGKTLLACMALQAVEHMYDKQVRFVSASGYVKADLDLVKNPYDDQLRDRLETYRTCDLLGLDDMGAEHHGKSGYHESVLATLIRERYYETRPTLITTNLGPADTATTYTKRLLSLLSREAVAIIRLGSDARR